MKIAHINSVYGAGSTGKIVEIIHKKLLREGHQSLVFCGRNHPIISDDIPKETVVDMYYLFPFINHVIKGVIFNKHGLYSKRQTRNIIERLDKFNPDIVHIHNLHGFYINYELLFRYLHKKGIRIVWTLHDAWSFTGFCSHYSYNQCNEWKTGCNVCKYRDVYPYRVLNNSHKNYMLKKELYEGCNIKFVTPSIWLSEQLSSSMLKKFPRTVIHNGVNLDNFYNDDKINNLDEKYNLAEKRVLLAVSNGWTRQKGFNDLLRLSEMLHDEVLVIIGLDNNQIRKLKRYKNIIALSKTANVDELRKWYCRATAFINLSLDDTYPTVNIESVACGTPLVTYDEGGASELGKKFGKIISRDELDIIPKLLYSIAPVNIDVKDFSNERMIEKYIELYGEVRN